MSPHSIKRQQFALVTSACRAVAHTNGMACVSISGGVLVVDPARMRGDVAVARRIVRGLPAGSWRLAGAGATAATSVVAEAPAPAVTHTCADCVRTFKTHRGLTAHRRSHS